MPSSEVSMNKEFFIGIVHEWYDPLYRFALSLCKNPDDALDLTQSAFYKFSAKGNAIRDWNKAKSWLFSVLHREYIDQYRRRHRYPTTTLDLVPEQKSEQSGPPVNTIDASYAVYLLQNLDEKFRAPLTLFYLEQFSYKEISEVLEIPIGTVMSRLRRGKGHLRRQFENQSSTTPSSTNFPKKASNE